MKKKIIIIFIIISSPILGKKHYYVDYSFYQAVQNYHFIDCEIKHEKAKSVVNNFFNNSKYKVIIAEKYGYLDKMIYFAVEEYMPEKYFNAIKKGIIVDEDGKIDTIINLNNGIFHDKKKVIDFKEIGLYENEVQCMIINIYSKNKKNKNKVLWINLIDNEDNNINWSTIGAASLTIFELDLREVYRKDEYVLAQYTAGEPLEISLKWQKEKIEAYRKAKAQGKAVKSAAVKTEFEKYKKAGLVEE